MGLRDVVPTPTAPDLKPGLQPNGVRRVLRFAFICAGTFTPISYLIAGGVRFDDSDPFLLLEALFAFIAVGTSTGYLIVTRREGRDPYRRIAWIVLVPVGSGVVLMIFLLTAFTLAMRFFGD
jgi:hypothetical protein